ncbi:MAG: DNA methyltransferase [Bacillota bacterium]
MEKQKITTTVTRQVLEKLYSVPLPSTRKGLFYNLFPYPTKISPESIAVYIAVHTKPGDTVLDVFGGSGSTGLAALMCEHPTDTMRELARKLGLEPVWGARNAIIYEIGKYGAFAASVLAARPDDQAFLTAVKELFRLAKNEMGSIYDTVDPMGKRGVTRHIVYSDVVLCPNCGMELTYYQGMVRFNPMRIDGDGICPHCGHKDKASSFGYQTETVYDNLLGRYITRRKRVPVRVYGQSGSHKWVREATEWDVEQFQTMERVDYPHQTEPKELVWGELHRTGYHTGITHLHHFYTKRNFLVMSYLWEKAKSFEPTIRDAVHLLLLSYNAAHATLMARVVVKKGSKDFVLTGAQSGVLYVSSLPVEKNIFLGLRRKIGNFASAFRYLKACSGRIEVINASSQRLAQPDQSVDYVFTDPPFGDFIPYAEVNQVNELWLGNPTDREHEIIISPSQNKDISCYQKMMTEVFTEVHRVLKDNSYATVVFHSSKASVWNALCSAYTNAGFVVNAAASLIKSQASFKQVVSEGSVQGDPLILLSKGKGTIRDLDSRAVLDQVIENSKLNGSMNERQIYTDYARYCLERGIAVGCDAKTAYDYIIQRWRR